MKLSLIVCLFKRLWCRGTFALNVCILNLKDSRHVHYLWNCDTIVDIQCYMGFEWEISVKAN